MSSAEQATPGAEPARDVLDSSQAGALALRGSALRIGGYGGGMLLALISVPLLIRHLQQTGFGRYTTALSIATIAATLTEGGVNVIAVREYASLRGPERDAAMQDMLGIRLLLCLVGMIVAVVFAFAVGYSSPIVIGVAVGGVGLSIQLLQEVLVVPLQGTMQIGVVAAADLVRNAITTALIVVLVLAGAGIVAFLAVLTPAGLTALALVTSRTRGLMPLRPRFHPAAYRRLLRETFPYAIALALNSLYFRATVVIMSLEATAKQTGYFSTSFRVVEVLIALPVIAIGTAYPIVTRARRDDPDRFAYAARRMFELSVIVGVWVALALELGAGFIVRVLGGPSAAPAADVLRIQGLAVMGTFIAIACTYPLLSMRRYNALLIANLLGLVVTLAVALSLVPVLHQRGAAIATVAAEFTLAAACIAAFIVSQREVRLPLGILPLAAVAGGLGVLVGRLVGVQAVLDVCVGTAVYAAVLAVVGRFPPEVGHVLQARRAAGTARSRG